MNAPTQRKIRNRVIEGEPSHNIKVVQFFVGGFRIATAKAIEIVFCAMVGGGKTFIDEINSLVRDRFQRVFQKGHQDRVASLGQHPLECLVCGASADLREKFDPIRRDDSEIPLWDAQSLEIPQFVEVGKNFFWGIRNGTAPQPGERGSIRLWTDKQQVVELRKKGLGQSRFQATIGFLMRGFACGDHQAFQNRHRLPERSIGI